MQTASNVVQMNKYRRPPAPVSTTGSEWISPGHLLTVEEGKLYIGIAYERINGEDYPVMRTWWHGHRLKDRYPDQNNTHDLRHLCGRIIKLVEHKTVGNRIVRTRVEIVDVGFRGGK